MAQQAGIVADQPGRAGGQRIAVAVAFAEQPEHRGQHQHAEADQQPEGRLPAEGLLQHAADDRPDRRRQRHGHRHVGEDAGRAVGPVQVAHHGAAQHRPAAGAERLQEPAQNQHLDRRRQRAGDAGGGEDGHPGQDRRAPADAVGDQAVYQLRPRRSRPGRR